MENGIKAKLFSYNFSLQEKKLIQELQGIASIMIYDGKIDDSEIEFLERWVLANNDYLHEFPLSDLKELFYNITTDGIVDSDERKTLLAFLESIADAPEGNPVVENIFHNDSKITFSNKNFLFTGELEFGSRDLAQSKVNDLGGVCQPRITLTTDYLIVGSLGSEFYKYGRYGSKIEFAIKNNRLKKSDIKIIQEKYFINSIID